MVIFESDFYKVYEQLNSLVEAEAPNNNHRQANFKSKHFDYIIDKINSFAISQGYIAKGDDKITYNTAKLNYKDKNNPKSKWELSVDWMQHDVNKELHSFLLSDSLIKTYIENKTLQVYPKKVVIFPAQLEDNQWTADDLEKYGSDETVTSKMDELETRMFKRDNDSRTSNKRIKDFAYANYYEKLLPTLDLKGITNLKLRHETDKFSLDPDFSSDFIGDIILPNQYIEAKSYFDSFWNYVDTAAGHKAFGKYFAKTVLPKLGSLHEHTNYVIYINKATGEVICINALNFEDNWKVGAVEKFKIKN